MGGIGNINFNGGYGNFGQYYSQDFETVAKYALGTNLVSPEDSPFSGLGLMLGISTVPELFKMKNWYTKYNNPSEAWAQTKTKINEDIAYRKELLKDGGWRKVDTYKELYKDGVQANKEFEAELATKKAEYARKLAEEGKASFWTKTKAFFTGKDATELAKAKATKLGEAAKVAKEAATTTETASKALNIGAKASKFIKGNALFLAITGATELFTQVIPAYSQLGAGSGTKQLAKSTVKTAAAVGGWAAGAAVGSAIGTCLFPGVGTAVGAAIGAVVSCIGGCIGSWLAGKAADKIVGKNELELAKEKQAKQMAEEASKSPEAAQQLIAAANQRLQSEGKDSEDAKVVFGSLNKLKNANKQQAADTQSTEVAQNTKTTPSFTGGIAAGLNQGYYNLQSNPFFKNQMNYMDQDFMAMSCGLAS